MGILRKREGAIKEYLAKYELGRLEKPGQCEACGKASRLRWHGKYIREIVTLSGIHRIPIKRIFCPLCRHTFGLIPGFIEKFHKYGRDVITAAVKLFKRYKARIKEIAERMSELMTEADRYMETSTLYRWKNKFVDI